jgi:hypothetical protein
MGAAFQTMEIPGSVKRDEVRTRFAEAQDQDRYENGHSYSGGFGQASGLSFPSMTFESRGSAYDWLVENCQKWADAKAVTFNDADGKAQWLIAAWCAE